MDKPALKPMVVAGMMSGTSADGIDVAIVRIAPENTKGRSVKLLHAYSADYPADLRASVLAAMDAQQTSAAELARLNWRLGLAYAEAAQAALVEWREPVELIGCHGQTIYHQGASLEYVGRSLACTWQLGEMSLLAASTGLPVVSNFRPADMAVGGQGAPLVPYLDYTLFRHGSRNRVLQNLGGIGNLTAIPGGAPPEDVLAFDTGPANMIIDALMQKLFGRPFDENGDLAATGTADPSIVTECMKNDFFPKPPPKSAGREEFGERFALKFLAACEQATLSNADIIRTATAFTVETIRMAFEMFVQPRLKPGQTDYIVAGGGARNATMMRLLSEALGPLSCSVTTTDRLGLPSQSKEAAAFALLAYETWHHRPSNVPAATGASRPVILGQVIFGV